MDPVTIFFLAVVGLAAAPKVLPALAAGTINLIKKASNAIKEEKRIRRRDDKEYQAKLAEKRAVMQTIDKPHAVRFSSVKGHGTKDFNVTEVVKFDENKDKLYHGILKIRLQDGSIEEDHVFLFQPRVYSSNNVLVGPKLTKEGHLSDKNCYLAKEPGTQEIFRGYVPKREFMSGMPFDYVNSSVNVNSGNLKEFISIEIPQDSQGNYIPMDFTNKKELQLLREYVKARTSKPSAAYEFIEDRIRLATASMEKYFIDNRPKYAKAVETSKQEMQRVEKARRAMENRQQEQSDYYQWLAYRVDPTPEPGEEHVHGYGPMTNPTVAPFNTGGRPRGPRGGAPRGRRR